MNLDLVSFTVTAPGAGPTAAVAVAGDAASIRNGVKGGRICILNMWTFAQAAGFTRLLYPSAHDLVRNIQYPNTAGQVDYKLPMCYGAWAKPQDPLSVSNSGSATAGDVETTSLLIWYEDLPGVDAHLINLATLRKRGVQTLTVYDSLTPTVASTYSGARALNAGSDLFKADTDYAVLGVSSSNSVGAITLRGPDTGNLRFGFPGLNVDPTWTQNAFGFLSAFVDFPIIPVINSANRAGTFQEVLQNENLASSNVAWHLVELGK